MGIRESVHTFNSFLRTLIAGVAVALATIASYVGYNAFHAHEHELTESKLLIAEKEKALAVAAEKVKSLETTVADQIAQIKKQLEEIDRLATAIALLKVDRRVAELAVIDQGTDPSTGEMFTLVEWTEVNEENQPIESPRRFKLQGDVVYVDGLIVKFDDKYIEQADLDRGTSIVWFQRIFDEVGGPQKGYLIDKVGARPTGYERGGQMSEFEKQIWDDFWNLAHNPKKAEGLGIRALHGSAEYIKVRKGYKYKVVLRASDGLTFQPADGEAPEPAGPGA